jgi:hypothetical protein
MKKNQFLIIAGVAVFGLLAAGLLISASKPQAPLAKATEIEASSRKSAFLPAARLNPVAQGDHSTAPTAATASVSATSAAPLTEPAPAPKKQKASLSGEEVSASVTAGGKEYVVQPDQVGCFERVVIERGETVPVRVSYPEGNPEDLVVAAVEDGGQINKDQHVILLHLDKNRQLAFQFTASQEAGIFRVTLRKGTDVKTVELWAGPEPKLAGE